MAVPECPSEPSVALDTAFPPPGHLRVGRGTRTSRKSFHCKRLREGEIQRSLALALPLYEASPGGSVAVTE
jgi:hypothetical protein